MKEKQRRSYIVLVNYKSWLDTVECLESILKLTDQDFQVIIVDNSPDLESYGSIKEWAKGNYINVSTQFPRLIFPSSAPVDLIGIQAEDLMGGKVFQEKIILVKSRDNRGFAAANNIALNYLQLHSLGSYIWLLNNDTVVEPKSLDSLINVLENTGTDLLGSCLYEYYDPKSIQSVGGTYLPLLGKIKIKKRIGDKCDYPIGASMFITRYFLQEVGLMCEDYFLFFEEYDWVLRAKKKGLGFYSESISKIYHKGGAAIGNASIVADFYGVKSKMLFNGKFFRRSFAIFCVVFGLLYCLNRIRRGQIARVKLFFLLLLNPKLQLHEIEHK